MLICCWVERIGKHSSIGLLKKLINEIVLSLLRRLVRKGSLPNEIPVDVVFPSLSLRLSVLLPGNGLAKLGRLASHRLRSLGPRMV